MPILNNLYIGDSEDNTIGGTIYADELWGLGGNDMLLGGGGNDVLKGGPGDDTMDGGLGDDTFYVDSYGDKVVEKAGEGKDTICSSITYGLNLAKNVENIVLIGSADIDAYGNNLDNDLTGNSGDNDILGLDGNDYLSGNGGDDYLNGGTGNDRMLGGAGNDIFVVDSFGDIVTEYASEGTDTVQSSVSYGLGANVENLTLTGSNNITATGNDLNNIILGNSGNNQINGGFGADTMKGGLGNDSYDVDQAGDVVVEYAGEGIDAVRSTISYTLGANVEYLYLQGSANLNGSGNGLDNILSGNSGNNTLSGFGGHDILDGGLGADKMYGGTGDDVYYVDNAGDTVTELFGQGTDLVYTRGDIDYTLTAYVENLVLDINGHGVYATGNELKNDIRGNNSHNVIDGGLGADWMQGYDGDDTYYVDNAFDQLLEYAGQGNDTVYSKVDYTLGDNVEVLSLQTGNAVYGTGNNLNNTIFGNAGDNVLDGGGNSSGGGDSLSGLGGNDTFVFHAGQAHGDVVYEFEGNGAGAGDLLKFAGYGPGATFTQQTATEWLITSGDGTIQEIITLVGAPTVDASDFMFV